MRLVLAFVVVAHCGCLKQLSSFVRATDGVVRRAAETSRAVVERVTDSAPHRAVTAVAERVAPRAHALVERAAEHVAAAPGRVVAGVERGVRATVAGAPVPPIGVPAPKAVVRRMVKHTGRPMFSVATLPRVLTELRLSADERLVLEPVIRAVLALDPGRQVGERLAAEARLRDLVSAAHAAVLEAHGVLRGAWMAHVSRADALFEQHGGSYGVVEEYLQALEAAPAAPRTPTECGAMIRAHRQLAVLYDSNAHVGESRAVADDWVRRAAALRAGAMAHLRSAIALGCPRGVLERDPELSRLRAHSVWVTLGD